MTFEVEHMIQVRANKCSNVLTQCHPCSAAVRSYTDDCATPSNQIHTNSSSSRTEYTVNVANVYSSHNKTQDRPYKYITFLYIFGKL